MNSQSATRSKAFALAAPILLGLGLASSAGGATLSVTTTADSGAGSLRQAILDANTAAGADTIAFNIPGSGPFLIQPLTLLPPLAGETTLDGTTQPGYAGTPLIELSNFSGAGLRMTGTGSNTIRGVCIHDFNAGVQIESNGNHLEGCFIGTDPTGTAGPGNGVGIVITALKDELGNLRGYSKITKDMTARKQAEDWPDA
jgi:hypothetical protein